MTETEIIKEKKRNIYSSFFSEDYVSKFLFKSILHHVISLEIYENNNLLKITNDPNTAVLGANVLYTDVWSSMGEENQKDEKEKVFNGFTIDSDLVSKADKDAIILHCLPAYRSKEITDEIFESHKSRIFDQAENRLHAQQALLSCILQ